MDKHIKKFYNTKIKIHTAFSALLEEMSFDEISISKICEYAKINRSTFYDHYNNTIELAEEIEKETVARFVEKTQSFGIRKAANNDYSNQLLLHEKFIVPYLNFIKENKTLYKIYNSNSFLFHSNEHEKILKENIFIPAFKAYGINDQSKTEYLFAFYLTGFYAMVNKWVANDCIETPEKICEILKLCIRV